MDLRKCPTVRSGGTTSVRSALMPTLMKSRASMVASTIAVIPDRSAARGPIRNPEIVARDSGFSATRCPGMTRTSLLLRGRALHEGLAALHLVDQRGLVDLDDDGFRIDAEILHQRLGDVAHHADLLLLGAAGGHAHGNLRHRSLPLVSVMARPVPAIHASSIKQDVDARDKPAHDAVREWLSPLHVMAREYFAYLGDHLVLLAGELRGPGLAPFLIGGDRSRGLRALDQVLDLHIAARLFVRALDDHAGRVAAVGIFELVAHVLGIAEIELGADVRGAKAGHHLLIVGDAVAVEHGHHHGAELRARIELAEQRQRRLQP